MPQIQSTRPVLIQDEESNSKIRSLNDKQRNIFDLVHGWAKKSVKKLSSLAPPAIDPLHIFLTRKAGCGKSFLTKVLHQSLSKIFLQKFRIRKRKGAASGTYKYCTTIQLA